MFVGVDAHIDPANGSGFTEIQCEFATSQWGDVGIAPYAYLIVIRKTRTAKESGTRFFDYSVFISSFAACFMVSMTLSAASFVLPTAER